METSSDRREVYRRAQALLSRIYALPEGERDAFVDGETRADPALRDEVRWLLGALQAPEDTFLETPAAAVLGTRETGDLKVPAPRNYTLIKPLGEGGMGVVYLAERVEGDLKQVVALKLLNLMAMLNPLVVSRFLTERQLLARLNHPNIARLIDAGALSDGRPFLAMEYVEGSELDRYCTQQALSVTSRLKLFVKVCHAVQYAHQHLVIHRDLKPANVLVDQSGEPKLVDFGIARSWSSGDVATRTTGTERIMTLAYASPEQLSGQPVSTTTDVYSLGVILYELLAGERPWGGNATDPLALARAMGESQPLPPSAMRQKTQGEAAARAKGLTTWRWRVKRDLPQDLDAIVLKALRHQAEERYDSVQALADDIERFLTNRPVLARQGHIWYQASKFLRRHWLPLVVTAAVVAMTATYIVDRQRQLAATEAERAKVAQVRDFLIGLFREVQPAYTQGQNISAKEMLDRGAKRLADNPPADPTTRVTLSSTLAETYHELGEYQSSLRIAEAAHEDAMRHGEIDRLTAVQAKLTLGGQYAIGQQPKLAEPLLRAVIAAGETDPSVPRSILGAAHNSLSLALTGLGRPRDEIIHHSLESIRHQVEARNPPDEIVDSWSNLGLVVVREGQVDRGAGILRDGNAFAAQHLPPHHPSRLVIEGNYSEALYYQGELAKAEQLVRAVLAGKEKALGPEDFRTGVTRARLALVLMAELRHAEAIPLLERQMELTRAVQKAESPSYVSGLLNLATGYRGAGQLEQAEAVGREAVQIVARPAFAEGARTRFRAITDSQLAWTLALAGKTDEAARLAAAADQQMAAGKEIPRLHAFAWLALAEVARRLNAGGDQERYLAQIIGNAKVPWLTTLAKLELARLLHRQGNGRGSLAILEPLAAELARTVPGNAPIVLEVQKVLQASRTHTTKG